MTLSIKCLFATLSINDAQNNKTRYQILYWCVQLCWVSLLIHCYAKCNNAESHFVGYNYIQHNDTQLYNIQQNDIQHHYTWHNKNLNATLSITAASITGCDSEWCYVEHHLCRMSLCWMFLCWVSWHCPRWLKAYYSEADFFVVLQTFCFKRCKLVGSTLCVIMRSVTLTLLIMTHNITIN